MQHSKGFKGGRRPKTSVPQPVTGVPAYRPPSASKVAFAERPLREFDSAANRAQRSLLKSLEDRDKESLAEEIGVLRKELFETKEAAAKLKQEKQRQERDLYSLEKQVQELKSQQVPSTRQSERQQKIDISRGYDDAELSRLESALQGVSEERERKEVDEDVMQYLKQLQRLQGVLESLKQEKIGSATIAS